MPGLQTSMKRNRIRDIFDRMEVSSVKAALSISFLNQIVSSGGNFIVGVYLARMLSLEDFGWYGISFGICMLYIGVGNALILTQMVVTMPDKVDADKERYAARMLLAVIALGALTLGLAAAAAAAIALFHPAWNRFIPIGVTIAVTAVAFLGKEFFISYAFMRRKETLALVVSGLSVAILCGGLAIEYMASIAPTAQNALLLYAAGALAGAAAGYLAAPISIGRGAKTFLPEAIDAWHHGRWALGGVSATWVQAQTYTYVLALFLGPAGVGQANAARIFISPFSFLIPAINKIAIPRLAELRPSNRGKMFHVSLLLAGGLFSFSAIYSLLMLANLDFVTHLVLGRNDPAIKSLVWIWCVVLAIQMTLTVGSGLLQALKKFRILTLVNIPSAIVAVSAAILLIRQLGAPGAIWGMAAGELVFALLIWKEIRNDRINGN